MSVLVGKHKQNFGWRAKTMPVPTTRKRESFCLCLPIGLKRTVAKPSGHKPPIIIEVTIGIILHLE